MAHNKDLLGSLNKAIDLLETFNEDNLSQSMDQMSLATGFPKTSVFRIAQTLVARGWLLQNPSTKRYSLGFGLMRYSKLSESNDSLISVCDPLMCHIRDELNEMVVLTVPAGDYFSMCLHIVSSARFIKLGHTVGAKGPLYAGAAGRCILANSTDAFIDHYLENFDRKPFTKNTIIEAQDLRREIKRAREDGYVVSCSEVNDDTMSISVPLFNSSGYFLACMNVASLQDSDSPEFRLHALSLLFEAAKAIRSL